MQKEIIYLVELSQSEIEGLIAVLDTVVKSHGISVAVKCGELHKILMERSNPKEESTQLQPEKVEEVASFCNESICEGRCCSSAKGAS